MDYSCIVFDTAPTGHTLRLLQFPSTLEKGLSKLLSLMETFGGMIGQVSRMMGPAGAEDLPNQLMGKLEQLKVRSQHLRLRPPSPSRAGGAGRQSSPARRRWLALAAALSAQPPLPLRPPVPRTLQPLRVLPLPLRPVPALLPAPGAQSVVDEVNAQFRDPELTTFVCVCIPEFLSLYETERLVQELARFEIDCHNVVINQVIFPEEGEAAAW